MKKVYISGKVSGLSIEECQANFKNAENKLRYLGFNPINPVKRGTVAGYEWNDYMKEDLKLLCDCDYIYQLDNWKDSKGANVEYELSKLLKIPVLKANTLSKKWE